MGGPGGGRNGGRGVTAPLSHAPSLRTQAVVESCCFLAVLPGDLPYGSKHSIFKDLEGPLGNQKP